MESIEANIVNSKKPYDGLLLDNIYYLTFDDDTDNVDVVLSYGLEINDQKAEKLMNHMWKIWNNTL